MCDCIKEVDAKMAQFNTKVMLPWFGPQRPFVEVAKVDDGKRGKPRKLFASCCPFCGERYAEFNDDPPLVGDYQGNAST